MSPDARAADLLLDALPAAPIVTVRSAATLIGRSVQATNQAVEQLTRAGVLVAIKDVRRNCTFEATDVFDLLTGFERALASSSGDTRAEPPIRRVPARPRRR